MHLLFRGARRSLAVGWFVIAPLCTPNKNNAVVFLNQMMFPYFNGSLSINVKLCTQVTSKKVEGNIVLRDMGLI